MIYFTLTQAAVHLGISRQAVTKAAAVEGWAIEKAGTVWLIPKSDIYEYRDHQIRTGLVKKLGWSKEFQGNGLYRNDDIDISCPICGGFAVEWPAVPELSNQWLCINGHKGEL